MRRRLAAVSFVILAVTIPAFARVLSYAPYSNRTSLSGIHERTTRHFVLVESIDDSNAWQQQQLVLYDTTGAKEPRVVYPLSGGTAAIAHAALYEREGNPAAPPMLLASVHQTGGLGLIFSADGGTTWKNVAGTQGKYLAPVSENDFGGPWTQGLTGGVRIGNDAMPFIVSFSFDGVIAINANGDAQPIALAAGSRVIGQDRNASRLLIREPQSIVMVDVTGANRKVLMPIQTANYSGWITADGSAYVQITHGLGRFLLLYRNGQMLNIGGPTNAEHPPVDTTWPNPPVWRNPMDFFAVPTHDFEGAWMIQRGTNEPTSLWRHLRAAGFTRMWVDNSRPEVEALIAGESGQTLLVQVHRDRSIQMQRLFIDPALAVWRIGEGAPRDYDELYLNEEWNKGFVHVDVDRMKAGEPFVFNSGANRDQVDGDLSPVLGGGGDVVQEWGVVRGSLKQHLVLPGVARLNGAFSSSWRTDVTIHNPLATTQDVDVRFVALGEQLVQALGARQRTLTLQPHEIRFVPDVLQALFSIDDGGGALHFIPASGMNVVGRTYSTMERGGTFGFGMQAIDYFNTASPRFPVSFAGAFPGGNFRTNVLITDTSGRGTEATLNAFGVSGPIGASAKTIDAPPGGILQFNNMNGTMGLFSSDAGGLVVQPTRGTAIVTVVAIDNQSNDPTYFPPDLPASNEGRTIPVIGHVDGAFGSHFRSDLYLFNPTAVTSTVTLEAKAWDGPAVKWTSFTLLPREARVVRDALPALFQMEGLARVRYWSDTRGDGVRVTSRTYTIDDRGVTYGSLIPALNNFQIAGPGDRLEILGISGGNDFRVNLGLVEVAAEVRNEVWAPNVRIRIMDGNTQLDTFDVRVPPDGGMQVNDIFQFRGITPPEAAMIVVEVLHGGPTGAYVTLVDNITNDSTYLGAQLGAQEPEN